MGSGLNAVSLAGSAAALLFMLALWPSAVAWRHRRSATVAGIVILGAATGYGMDAVNMPEIVGTLVIGSAGGLLLGRELPRHHLSALMTVVAGMVGLAMIAVALAAWLNPHVFGLTGAASDGLTQANSLLIALCMATGAVACAGAGIALSVVKLAPMPDARAAAWMVGIAGMTGWSIAAAAFLLENAGLVVAGGLTGSAGTALALRSCGMAWRKGLAEPLRRP